MWSMKMGKSKTFFKSQIVRLSEYNLIFRLPSLKEPSENSPSLKYRHLIMFYQTSGDLKILKIQGLFVVGMGKILLPGAKKNQQMGNNYTY